MTPANLLILVGFLAGCGAAQPSNAADRRSGSVAAADPGTIPSTWEELLEVSEAVYFGAWSVDTRQDGEGCLTLDRVVHPPSTTGPERLCATSSSLMNESSWIDSEGPSVYAFVELSPSGEPQIAGVANEQSGLLELVRCARVARFWAGAPAAHRSCDVDSDCEALSAMCFSDAVAISYAEPYREVATRFGGACLAPDEGACPQESYHAKCVTGQCRAFPNR